LYIDLLVEPHKGEEANKVEATRRDVSFFLKIWKLEGVLV